MPSLEESPPRPYKPWLVVEEFRCAVRESFGTAFTRLILYGSHARGEETEDSDIDLIVLFEDKSSAKNARKMLSDLAYKIELEHDEYISPLPMAELDYQKGKSPFFLNVKREGVLIVADDVFEMRPEIDRLMELARESLDVAQDILASEHYGFAASRAYYAMFYATQAILLSKGMSFSSHRAVVAAFGQHIAHPGLVDVELHGALKNAFEQRLLGDYSTDPFPQESSETVLADAGEFVAQIEAYLQELMGDQV